MKVVVSIMPKRSVLDPQGKAVEHAMHNLGFSTGQQVRVGKRIEFEVASEDSPATREAIDRICRDLLSNPVIEDYTWTTADSGSQG